MSGEKPMAQVIQIHEARSRDHLGEVVALEDQRSAFTHKVYSYLLRHLTIDQPYQVWCADVTDIPMRRGFLYLVAKAPNCPRKQDQLSR